MRVHHYSIRTEQSYWYWIRYFIRLHQLRHPLELGPAEVNAFLTWLAVERKVAAATQNLALNALAFLYDKVLQQPIGQVGEVGRAKRLARIPCVLTHT
jgi:Phage integrase, N-terminal SAM-like domain